jgi:hypothetical protein
MTSGTKLAAGWFSAVRAMGDATSGGYTGGVLMAGKVVRTGGHPRRLGLFEQG